jgi:hypothetical protein
MRQCAARKASTTCVADPRICVARNRRHRTHPRILRAVSSVPHREAAVPHRKGSACFGLDETGQRMLARNRRCLTPPFARSSDHRRVHASDTRSGRGASACAASEVVPACSEERVRRQVGQRSLLTLDHARGTTCPPTRTGGRRRDFPGPCDNSVIEGDPCGTPTLSVVSPGGDVASGSCHQDHETVPRTVPQCCRDRSTDGSTGPRAPRPDRCCARVSGVGGGGDHAPTMWVMHRGFVWSPPPPVDSGLSVRGAELAECIGSSKERRTEDCGSSVSGVALRQVDSRGGGSGARCRQLRMSATAQGVRELCLEGCSGLPPCGRSDGAARLPRVVPDADGHSD